MQLQFLSIVLATVALSACAAAPAPEPQVATQDTSNCHLEYRTGSSIPNRNCNTLTDDQRAQQKRDVDDLQRSLNRGSTRQAGGSGS